MARNKYYEDLLIDSIQKACREARRDGVVPTHVGMHPEDVRLFREWQGVHYRPCISYGFNGFTTSITIVEDDTIEEGSARVCNRQAAFVAGYIDELEEVKA
jgi:hypothetical protein